MLLLSVWFGGLAEKYDCRRLIQVAQGLFMLVSMCWGVLFWTGHGRRSPAALDLDGRATARILLGITGQRLAPLWTLAAATGMRRGELMGLT